MQEVQQEELDQNLSLLDATMINVGSMIGSGIFIVPSSIALYLDGSFWVLAAWALGGVISLFGALSIAELGAMMPKAGGQVVYLSQAYHPIFGFLYGWANFAVIMTGSIAAVGVGFATYFGFFIQLSPLEIKAIAVGSIIFLTVANCVGVAFGVALQNIFTFSKIGALFALIVLTVVLQPGSMGNFLPLGSAMAAPSLIGQFGLATIAVLWAYDGWIEITYVAGEVKDPQRNIPRSLWISTVMIIALYVTITAAFIYILPGKDLVQSKLVASDAAVIILGPAGAVFITIAVIVSMFGANNGFVFTGARIYYAMAREKTFVPAMGVIHPRFKTPFVALAAQGVWACLLVFTGTYEELITYVVFASWFFYALSCAAVIVLRRTQPGRERPYKTWGYPLTPAIFILFAIYLAGNTIIEDWRSALIGAGIILSGVPLFYFYRKPAEVIHDQPS